MQMSGQYRGSQLARGISVGLLLVTTSVAQACLWDWDTLQMERRRFPGTLEMITGKFARHSPAYYEWRIQDRTKRMRSPAEDPALADDLAVAYSKLGKHAEGIALLEQVLAAHPDRYETLANLGTIHMLAGDLKVGKDYIDRAIVINPDAHFGREKYQSLLAEYFLTKKQSLHPAAAPELSVIHPKGQFVGFAKMVMEQHGWVDSLGFSEPSKWEAIKAELATAQKGVLGMMHFANYDSPLLLEALGDLLIAWPTYEDDALQLGARAYYRVAQVTEDPAKKREFQLAAANMLAGHLDYINYRDTHPKAEWPDAELEKLATELNRELAEARTYVNSIAVDERRWIEQGVNVDRAYAAKYYDSLDRTINDANQRLAAEPRDVRGNYYEEAARTALLKLVSILVAFAVLTWGAIVAYRRIRLRFKRAND